MIFIDRIKILSAIIMVVFIALSFSACNLTDLLEFQNDNNTVNGMVELSDRISEEAKNGVAEITLYVENAKEEEIKNMTTNMGLFWGSPTEYSVLNNLQNDNTLKIKFFIEKSNNYYVVEKYMNNVDIPENNTEAAAILKALKSMIDKEIDKGMSDYEKEITIHDWLVNEIEYDENIDASSTENGSYGAMVNKKSMCRGYAESMKLISECCGLETKVIVGEATDQDGETVGHAWNLINLNDKWYHLDATYDDPIGDNSKNRHYYYFNLNDTDLSKDHSWEADYFPVCDNDSYMYYKKNSIYYSNYTDFRSAIKETLEYDKPSYVEVLLDANAIYEDQLRFVFDLSSIKSITWSTHGSDPVIVSISPDYY